MQRCRRDVAASGGAREGLGRRWGARGGALDAVLRAGRCARLSREDELELLTLPLPRGRVDAERRVALLLRGDSMAQGTFLLDSYIEKKIGNVGSGKAYYQSGK